MTNPLKGIEFFATDTTPAARTNDPRLHPIASQPRANWFTGFSEPGAWLQDGLETANRVRCAITGSTHATAVLVLYNIPNRDLLGAHSQGGADTAQRYLEYVAEFSNGIRNATQAGFRDVLHPPPIVILEPDALADCQNMDPIKRWTRIELVKTAHKAILWTAPCHLYIDIGNPDFITDPLEAADILEEAGIFEGNSCKPRGFSVNVSNFYSTEKCEAYADEISAHLDGVHYVIDTSRNGNGHIHKDQWCNPPGRRLGTPPTIDTGHELCDAYLWIKNPGESDGPENGGPEAGKFWPEYALELCGE
jgi:endoglucanase